MSRREFQNATSAVIIIASLTCVASASRADTSSAELAKKLSNPVASLISVPFQFNYDENIGPEEDGDKTVLNVQPVIPITLNQDWNLISRTIVPLISQHDIFPGAGSQTGLGDTVQSLFFSPKAPTAGGLIWGVGPVFLVPTASNDRLGGEKWGAGPTGLVLKQAGPWTYGVLANHIWSFAGTSSRTDISATFVQPFLSYTTPTAWTYGLNSESTYDWKADDLSMPLNLTLGKLVRFGKQPVSFTGGLRYWIDSAKNGPEDFGLRFAVVLLFPK